MDAFLAFFADNGTALLTLFLFVAGLALLTQWFAWIFGWGRFAGGKKGPTGSLVVVFGDLLTKIIDDFRHLLALIIVVIFALALAVGMYVGKGSIDDLAKAMQAVVATLGGLVGSIIGYYFGESTVLKQQKQDKSPTPAAVVSLPEQDLPETPEAPEGVTPAPLPASSLPPADSPDADDAGSS